MKQNNSSMENEFRSYIDQNSIGFSRSNRRKYKESIAEQLGVTFSVIERWYGGLTEPSRLQKIAVNTEIKQCVFTINEQ